MEKQNVIIRVDADSIAQEMGIEVGDILIDINNKPIKDVLDYRYLIQDEYIELGIRKPNGEDWLLEIEKDEFEDIGIVFESGLMDKARHCSNKCIFCFIDQLPKGMRESLYFKDDDSRLSFLQGNYITLTNMKEEDLERVIFYHLSPINISVHATDPELRKFMLKNPKAVNIMDNIKRLAEHNIEMNFQIVLCKGVNDGEQLDRSISDLSQFIDPARSMSIVPLGMTKFREGLYEFELFDKNEARDIIKQVGAWQERFLKEKGTRFCFLSDEFYLTAELPMPNGEFYEGYPQLENGVGMITSMKEEFVEEIDKHRADKIVRNLSIATGKASYDFIFNLSCDIMNRFENTHINVCEVRNDFFGENITVSGLMTGQDIIEQLKDKKLGKYLLIPENAIRTEELVLLDDVSIEDIERELNVNVVIAENDGRRFIQQILELED